MHCFNSLSIEPSRQNIVLKRPFVSWDRQLKRPSRNKFDTLDKHKEKYVHADFGTQMYQVIHVFSLSRERACLFGPVYLGDSVCSKAS